jgi:hypothetical protein
VSLKGAARIGMRGLEWNCFVTLFCSVLWSTEETNKKSLEKTVQRMGKEAVQWGLVAGVYTGMTYGMQEARGVHDWVCINFSGLLFLCLFMLTCAVESIVLCRWMFLQ